MDHVQSRAKSPTRAQNVEFMKAILGSSKIPFTHPNHDDEAEVCKGPDFFDKLKRLKRELGRGRASQAEVARADLPSYHRPAAQRLKFLSSAVHAIFAPFSLVWYFKEARNQGAKRALYGG